MIQEHQQGIDVEIVKTPSTIQKSKKFVKLLQYAGIVFLFLFFIVLLIGYYFLNTTAGLQQAISLTNNYTNYHIKTDKVTGNLLSTATLNNFSITGKDLDFHSTEIVLSWKPKKLFKRQINIDSIRLKNASFTLFPNSKKEEKKVYEPIELNDLSLPFEINIENIIVENFIFKSHNKQAQVELPPIFIIKRMEVGIDYEKQTGRIQHFFLNSPEIDATIKGEIKTKDSYPAHLELTINYHHATYGQELLTLDINGAIKKTLNLIIKGKGISEFTLNSKIQSLPNKPNFTAKLNIEKLDTTTLNYPQSTTSADINLSGHYSNQLALKGIGSIWHDSPQTDKVKLDIKINTEGNLINLSNITLNLLTTKQQLKGRGYFNTNTQELMLDLDSSDLSWPQNNSQSEWLAKKLKITVKGILDNYQLTASSNVDTHFAGNVPIQFSALGNTKALSHIDAKIQINNQPISLKGDITWQPKLSYQLALNAKSIKPIAQFPGIEKLNLTGWGEEDRYQIKGALSFYAKTIPNSDIILDTSGSFTQLDTAKLLIKTLGGEISLNANGRLSPLDLVTKLQVKHIQPQTFYREIKGDISGDIFVTAKQDDQTRGKPLTVVTTINDLQGKLQGSPIKGGGTIIYDKKSEQLTIEQLLLDIAKNKLTADGKVGLTPGSNDSSLTAKINAQHLQSLLPTLSGKLVADIVARGNLAKPEIQANIDGNNLGYQNYRVKSLKSIANISLKNDKVQFKTNAKKISINKGTLDNAMINISGKLSAHRILAQITPIPTANSIPELILDAKGGLSLDKEHWIGVLNKLSLTNQSIGKWRLKKPSQLTVSKENVISEALCLYQQSAQLCTSTRLVGEKGTISTTIDGLKTQTLSQFLPENLKIDSIINGKLDINLNNKSPIIKGHLFANNGQISFLSGNGELTSKIQQFDTQFSVINNRLDSMVRASLSKLGRFDIKVIMPDTHANQIKGNIKIDNRSLAFLEEIAPQIGHIKGQLQGNMNFIGNPNKSMQLSGKIDLQKTNFDIPQYGTEIRGLTLSVFAKNGHQIGFKGEAMAGSGQFTINGSLDPIKRNGEIAIKGKNFQLANTQKLQLSVDPNLQILFSKDIKIRGNIIIPKALIIPESTGSKITVSEDVILPNADNKKTQTSSPIDAVVTVILGDDVRIASADIETRLSGKLDIIAKPNIAPTAGGIISIQTGELRIYGQNLNIQRGRVIFSHGPIANPALDIQAVRHLDEENITVGTNVLGTVKKPAISLFSVPPMPDTSILSYLLFGRAPNSESFSTTTLLQTGGLVGANTLSRDIRSSIGLDVLDFSLSSMEAGKNLSRKLYVGVRSNFFDAINHFLVKYRISGRTHINGTFGSDGVSVDLTKTIETN